ncbi:hypothetical protein MY764_09525, partial [Haemophilus influenzae]
SRIKSKNLLLAIFSQTHYLVHRFHKNTISCVLNPVLNNNKKAHTMNKSLMVTKRDGTHLGGLVYKSVF